MGSRRERLGFAAERAATRLGLYRPDDLPSLQAAGRSYDLDEEVDEIKAIVKRREKWQEHCWDAFDVVPEIKYPMNFLASSCARVRLVPAIISEEPNEPPVPLDGTERYADVVAGVVYALRDEGDQASILRSAALNLGVPGDGWLLGRKDAAGEEDWQFRSIEEIDVRETGDEVYVLDKPGDKGSKGEKIDKRDPTTSLIRVWQTHPRWRGYADSHVRAILEAVTELLIIDRAFRSRGRSRISDTGLLAYPSDLELPAPEVQSPTEEKKPRTLAHMLMDAFLKPIRNEDSASAVAPIVVRYKANAERRSGIEHIEIKRERDEMLFKRAEFCLRRIAQGLPVPPEIVFGLSEATHWGGGQIQQSAYADHVEPFVNLLVQSIVRAYLWRRLRTLAIPDAEVIRFTILADPSELLVHPKLEEAADFGLSHAAISRAAWRRLHGIPESDAPDEEEEGRIIEILQAIASKTEVPAAPADDSNPNAPPEPEDEEAAVAASGVAGNVAGNGSKLLAAPARDLGRELAEIDLALLQRVLGAADASTRRALEKAGSRLWSLARKDDELRELLRDVPRMRMAATLGPERVRALSSGDLLEGAFDEVAGRFSRWSSAAAKKALSIAPAVEEHVRDAALLELESAIDGAAVWLADELKANASELLYDPDRRPAPGEDDETILVPAGVVREALARAGGDSSAITAAIGERLGRSAKRLLLATGPVVRAVFKAAGWAVGRYRWFYGPVPRTTFEPHKALDGITYDRHDDPRLANVAGWPRVDFYSPGDHDGCWCLEVPAFDAATLPN